MSILRTISIAIIFLLVAPSVSLASGGTVTYTDSNGLNPRPSSSYEGGYVVETFTTVGTTTFTAPSGVTAVDYLVVGGGGGGGSVNSGAGGAGGFRAGSNYTVTPGSSMTVVVGAGGMKGNPYGGNNGYDSVFGSIVSIGGGGGSGGGGAVEAKVGGSGGSGGYWVSGAAGTAGQGHAGGAGSGNYPVTGAGGGGGAGEVGDTIVGYTTTDGGAGLSSSISGISTYYAGGGGGWGYDEELGLERNGLGGSGGGGLGTANYTSYSGDGGDGIANTGGGGGGSVSNGGNGGSGIVILRYRSPGTVNVTSNVASSWVITGPATITGSGTSQSSPSKPAGTYTITWGDVAGYTAPATQSLTLISGSTITFNGTYVAATCSVSSVSWSVSGTSCGNDAYGPVEIADGASVVVPSTNGNTGDVTLTCTAGEVSQTSPTCAVPSATLSGSNCTIASGGASCAAPFTWAISNATTPNLFNSTTGIQYTTAPSGTGVSYAITKGNNTVQARNGTTVLRSTPVTATCASGTVWDGSVCAPTNPPTVSISASPRRVGVGGSSTISWSSNHVTSCTVTKNDAFLSSAHTSAGTLDTGITAQTEYKIDCEGNDGSTGNTATVLVNVNPGFTEF